MVFFGHQPLSALRSSAGLRKYLQMKEERAEKGDNESAETKTKKHTEIFDSTSKSHKQINWQISF